MSWYNLYSLAGCLVLLSLAWLSSSDRARIPWKTILLGMGTMGGLGLIIFLWPTFRSVLILLNRAVAALMTASGEGARFLFGPLAAGPGEAGGIGFILAFHGHSLGGVFLGGYELALLSGYPARGGPMGPRGRRTGDST